MTVAPSSHPDTRIAPAAGFQDFLGHPKGLAFLFTTEMWERFSYYGMRALLVLYMVKYLLLPDHPMNVVGFAGLKSVLEACFGPLDAQPLASQIYGIYTALVYFTPYFGGLLADRLLGQRRTVLIGAVLMAAGHFMMAFEPMFLFALLLLILGNGCFKPNVSSQVGGLYAHGDQRIDRAYSIFYVGINLGAFFSPLVCGTLGEEVGWHYGFGAAGVGMVIGLITYIYGLRHLPPDARTRNKAETAAKEPLTSGEKRRVWSLVILCAFNIFFWACYEQAGNTIALWADDYTDRALNLGFWQIDIRVTWFQSVNPLMIFTFTPLVLMWWTKQAKTGTEPTTVNKMALGCALVGLANVLMIGAALLAGEHGRASWVWLIGYFALATTGELYLSPIGLSLVSTAAPTRLVSQLMGMWFLSSFFGNYLSGYLGGYWSKMAKPEFFIMIATISFVAALAIWACNRPLVKALNEEVPDRPGPVL